MDTIIGYDTTDGHNEKITLTAVDDLFYISCDVFDWAHDVTEEQAGILTGSNFDEKIKILDDVTCGCSESWFEAA